MSAIYSRTISTSPMTLVCSLFRKLILPRDCDTSMLTVLYLVLGSIVTASKDNTKSCSMIGSIEESSGAAIALSKILYLVACVIGVLLGLVLSYPISDKETDNAGKITHTTSYACKAYVIAYLKVNYLCGSLGRDLSKSH